MFRNVGNVLKEGGLFFFDLNMEETYLNHWDGFFSLVDDDNVCAGQATHDSKKRSGWREIAVFRHDGEWRRKDVLLEQTGYTREQVEYHLKRAGFAAVEAYDRPLTVDLDFPDFSGRTFFLARSK